MRPRLRLVRMNATFSPEWACAIDAWATAQRAGGAPETTLSTRTYHLRRLAAAMGTIEPWEVTADDLIDWTGRQVWAGETRRGYRNSFRAFYSWAIDTGRTDVNPALGLPRVKPSSPNPRPAPDRVYREALLAAGRRERLIVRLAAEMGLRRAEVAVVHSSDLIEDLAGWSLRVHGKGGRTRVVPLPPSLAAELRALPPGWAFPGRDRGHLSPRWVGKLVTRLLPDEWTMHTLRHRFATRAYAVDRDVFTVQELLGHASPATTRVYVQPPDDARRRLVHAVAGIAA